MKKFAKRPNVARRPALVGGTLAAVSLLAAACGAGAATSTNTTVAKTTTTTGAATASPSTTAVSTPASGPTRAAGFAPAASGTIASISGLVLEVQSPSNGQTTVDLTAKTAITATVLVPLSDLTKGTCVSASGTKGSAGAVDATVVTIEAPVNGACTGRAYGGSRGAPGGTFTTRPSGPVPSTHTQTVANVASAFGKVSAISGSTITVQGVSFTASASPTSRAPTSGTGPAPSSTLPKTGPVTVNVTAQTKYSRSALVTASSLKIGECATAIGNANDIGVVTATRLSVSQATAQGCTTGFRGAFGGGFSGSDGSGPSSAGPAGTSGGAA